MTTAPLVFALLASVGSHNLMTSEPIDRKALVSRHDVVLNSFVPDKPLQVGNGEFAFGLDATGLQTFAPFNTMSHWGWNSLPLPAGQTPADFHGQVWETHGRPIRYPMPDPEHPEISDWLAGNPHAINLGRVGFILKNANGTMATEGELMNISQKLDLWKGTVASHFEVDGVPVSVITACHPSVDQIAVRVESPLIKLGRLTVFLDCPSDNGNQFDNFVGDRSSPAKLELDPHSPKNAAEFLRPLGENSYRIRMSWQSPASLLAPEKGGIPFEIVKAEYGAGDKWLDVTDILAKRVVDGRMVVHVTNDLLGEPILGKVKTLKVSYRVNGQLLSVPANENETLVIDPSAAERRYRIKPDANAKNLEFTCAFSPKPLPASLPSADKTIAASEKAWPAYWRSGGAIDLSGSTDPRWKELERRIVLSQYLMKVNEAGGYPPQESGLVNNGWFGRWHMEMVLWHSAHWALWNRFPELNRSMGIYQALLPVAEKRAKGEGYEGARWPKCIGPNFVEWPHIIHSLLLWQQPHPIFFAELDYRAHPTKATLKKWMPVVESSANFLASYAFYEKENDRYVLGPPLVMASENGDPATTQNPTYELGYWRYGLRTAQEWRKRAGLKPVAKWDDVLKKLSPLPVQDGVYVLHEGVKDMWTKWNFEHPALTATYGMLPGDGVDPATMGRTLDKISTTWNFERTWGWDYPMLAMCAARLGKPDEAIDFLMTSHDGFQFDERGLATGGPFPYFPSNGGLLYSVALMAAGWDGAPKKNAPGFPDNGKWKVRWEGLNTAP